MQISALSILFFCIKGMHKEAGLLLLKKKESLNLLSFEYEKVIYNLDS